MDKAQRDPVASANAAVTEEQKILDRLIKEEADILAREKRLIIERSKIAYLAHSGENAKAKDRLSEIHRELYEISSETAGYVAAIEEAKLRLAASLSQVGREKEKRLCREALNYVDTLVQHAQAADCALRNYRESIVAVDKTCERICAIARHPSRVIVIGAIRRSLSAALTPVHAITEIPLCDPQHRHPLSYWANSWSVSIRNALQARIDGVPEQQPEDEVAA